MAPPKPKAKPMKKEKVFHPLSRKADQLVRAQLRKGKLADQARVRVKKHGGKVDIYSFFYHAIPPEGALSLEDIHMIVQDVWLARHDPELEKERAARRKGRPKSTKELKLEEAKLRESEEYRTGLEVIDLTDPPNVGLFRQWDLKEAPYLQQLRFIRISGESPTVALVSRPGRHPLLQRKEEKTVEESTDSVEQMDVDAPSHPSPTVDDEAPLLLEPPSRFGSTMMTMDGPIL